MKTVIIILNTILTTLAVIVVVLLFRALFDADKSGKVEEDELNNKLTEMVEDINQFVEETGEKLDSSGIKITINTGKPKQTTKEKKIHIISKFRGGEEFTISVEYSGDTELTTEELSNLLQKIVDDEAGNTYIYFKSTFTDEIKPNITKTLEYYELILVEIIYNDN